MNLPPLYSVLSALSTLPSLLSTLSYPLYSLRCPRYSLLCLILYTHPMLSCMQRISSRCQVRWTQQMRLCHRLTNLVCIVIGHSNLCNAYHIGNHDENTDARKTTYEEFGPTSEAVDAMQHRALAYIT